MIKRLLYLNGLAVITVILYHSAAWGFVGMFFWTDRYRPVSVPNFDLIGSPSYFALRTIEQLIIYGIPTFLFVSGFFIAISTGRSQKTIGWQLVLSRVKNLLIPFIIWSLLILAFQFVQGQRLSPLEFARTLLLGQTTEAYYFVPVLVQLYLLAPFLVPLARERWKLLLLMAGALQLVTMLLRYFLILNVSPGIFEPIMFLTRSWFFPGFIFWFAMGIVIGFHLQDFRATMVRFRWFFLSGLMVVFFVGMIEWELLLSASGRPWIGPRETLVDNFYAAFFLLTFFSFENLKTPLPAQISSLGKRSYGIYLVHSPVLEYTARLIYHVAPFMLAYQILLQPVLYVVGFGVPLLLMALVNRSVFRRYYSYLFG
jgi:peptidoglycan/LPS O-acetylase OafA/YrhL